MNSVKVLIINGPNLNMLGRRETSLYGKTTLKDLVADAKKHDYGYGLNFKIDDFQSNHEGELIDKIQNSGDSYDLIVINPGGLTHYSVCLRDALLSVSAPYIEVHITNIFAREEFRRKSLISDAAVAVVSGGGQMAYILGIMAGMEHLKK